MKNGPSSSDWMAHLPPSRRRDDLAKAIKELTEDGVTSANELEEALGENSRWYIVEAFKALDGAGIAKYIRGRHHYPTRIHWNQTGPGKPEGDKGRDTPTLVHSHIVRVSPRFTVSLELPADLTSEELKRLERWVGSLPVERPAPGASASDA